MQDTLLVRMQLGLLVYDLTADSVLYGYGEKQTLRPASTMKLLTAVTALDQLGGNYQLRTSLRYNGQRPCAAGRSLLCGRYGPDV